MRMTIEDAHPRPGIISSITPQKRSAIRYSVFIEGVFAFGLHADLLVSAGLHKGKNLSEADVEHLLSEDEYLRAREKAYHFLAYRQRSEDEIRQRLIQKGFLPDTANRVIERLIELGMVDDEQFARSFTEARIRSRGLGPSRVRQELRRLGVSPAVIESAVDTAYSRTLTEELALKTATKIWPRLQKEQDPRKRRKKLRDHLLRRGFSHEQTSSVIDELEELSDSNH